MQDLTSRLRPSPLLCLGTGLLMGSLATSACDMTTTSTSGRPADGVQDSEAPAGPGLRAARSVGFWPTHEDLDVDACFDLLREGADIAMFQLKMFETPPSLVRFWDAWFDKARGAGMKTYIALEIFDQNKPLTPASWTGPQPDCADPEWRAAYEAEAVRLAREYSPDYFCIAVESNVYYASDPGDYDAFREAFETTRRAVKAVSPDTAVFATYQYEVLLGLLGAGSPQWEILDGDKTLDQDLLGVSTYPLFQKSSYDPNLVPDDYYAPLKNRSSLRVFFGEIGWYSGSNVVPPSSENVQARFVRKLRTLLGALDLEAYCWINLVDMARHEGTEAVFRQIPQFTSLALFDAQLRAKPAWDAWVSLDEDLGPSAAVAPGTTRAVTSPAAPGYPLQNVQGLGATIAYSRTSEPAAGMGLAPPDAAWVWSYRISSNPLAALLLPAPAFARGQDGITALLWSQRETRLAWIVTESGGARYAHDFAVGAGEWRVIEAHWSSFELQSDSADDDGRLDPTSVTLLTLIDVSFVEGKSGDNELQLGAIQPLLKD